MAYTQQGDRTASLIASTMNFMWPKASLDNPANAAPIGVGGSTWLPRRCEHCCQAAAWKGITTVEAQIARAGSWAYYTVLRLYGKVNG